MGYFDLTGERALIIGSGGIGGAIAGGAAAAGAEIVLADASTESLERARAAVEKAGGKAHVIRQEIRSRDDIVALYERVNKALPGITLSVNAVGLSVMAPAIETTEDQWRTVLSGFL
ncbi:MAG: SDR family NAD(P)-dependent oxidoreductase, partial [Treponema sp.]|nr:SDR family NAD(P)-dependent oxidoreductase [Treponema sp.]